MSILIDLISTSVQRHPFLLRSGLDLLRRSVPLFKLGNTVVVLGADQVRAVLERPRDFLNGMVYAPKLGLGPLMLGMDKSARYDQEDHGMQNAVGVQAMSDRFAAIVAVQAQAVLKDPLGSSFDFVSAYVEPVLVEALCEFFGIDPTAAVSRQLKAEQGLPTFIQWLRKLGGRIGAGNPAPFGLEGVADAVADEFRAFILPQLDKSQNDVVRVLGQNVGPQDATKAQLLDGQVRCVGGILPAAAALFKTATLALHQLLEHRAIDGALNAAVAGDEALVLAHIREAMRFHPPFPILTRYCPRPTLIDSTPVPAGANVVVALLAAMFDGSVVENPDEFSVLRPADTYSMFGRGLHECVAKNLAESALTKLFTKLLCRLHTQNVQISGPGTIVYDGPATMQYRLRLVARPPQIVAVSNATNVSSDPSSPRSSIEPEAAA